MVRPGPAVHALRDLAIVVLCIAWMAGSSVAAGVDGAPAPMPKSEEAAPAAAPGEPPKEAGAPAVPPPAHPGKEPRRESTAGGKKHFFKTPAGAITLAILGAVVVGAVVQSSLGAGSTASH
ncbi:MAG: hypothetical protein HY049_11095 [Acidobacteria bacterium]|nr:hypothetical protein [Acidobacteriota bacterium]